MNIVITISFVGLIRHPHFLHSGEYLMFRFAINVPLMKRSSIITGCYEGSSFLKLHIWQSWSRIEILSCTSSPIVHFVNGRRFFCDLLQNLDNLLIIHRIITRAFATRGFYLIKLTGFVQTRS